MINNTLREYLDVFVIAYLDDILVYIARELQDHVQRVKQVLEKLNERDLKVKLEKCKFYKLELNFLGFIIRRNGLRLDLNKVKSILE